MLYPDFNDLASYQRYKADKGTVARRKTKALAPGNYSSFFRGQGLDFDAVREYVPGDDIRNIDWRVTARTGSPHLKLFQETKERHTIICIDMNATMRFGTKNTFKSIQAARSASLLGWRASSQQDQISVCFFGDVPGGIHYLGSRRPRQTISSMLKMLSSPPSESHPVSLETTFQHLTKVARPGSSIYLISDFMNLSSSLLHNSNLLHLSKSCDLCFISVNDAADKSLFPCGLIGFHGQNAERLYINTDSIKGRDSYKLKWDLDRKLLTSLTRRFKIPLIELSTESDIKCELVLALKNIARRSRCLH